MIKLFPDAGFLIEKPISSAGVDQVDQVKEALKGRVVSVGYMLRYLKGRSLYRTLADCQLSSRSSGQAVLPATDD